MTHNAPIYRISTKSVYPRLRYFRRAPTRQCFSEVSGQIGPTNICQHLSIRGRVIDDSFNFHDQFFNGGNFGPAISQSWESDLHQIWEEDESLAFPVHLLDFRYVASFRNQSAKNWTASKIDAKSRTFRPV